MTGDYDSRTVLHLAACEKRVGVIEFLLDLKTSSHPNLNINQVDRMGGTPLDDAIRQGHQSVVELLREAGALPGSDPELQSVLLENARESFQKQRKLRQMTVNNLLEDAT